MHRSLALAHGTSAGPWRITVPSLYMRNELALSPMKLPPSPYQHMLFMRDSLDSIVEPVLGGRFYDWSEEEATYRADSSSC